MNPQIVGKQNDNKKTQESKNDVLHDTASHPQRNIKITLISGQLHLQDGDQKINTYAKIKYVTASKEELFEQTTKVDMNSGSSPKWNQQFEMHVVDLHQDLVLEVWQWEKNSDDQHFGSGKIRMQVALDYDGKPFGLDIMNKQKTLGTIQISVLQSKIDVSEYDIMMKDAQVQKFTKYIQETGLERAFKLIFAEILTKKIDRNEVYIYSAVRLRQIGGDLKPLFNKINNHHNLSQILNNISEVRAEDETQERIEISEKLIPNS